MDYKELVADLLFGCEENCTDCKYAGDSEFECTIAERCATAITDLLARAEAAEARAEKAERERDAAIQYMRKTFGWCTGCVHFTGIYGSGCKIGEMSTCGEENNHYVFCKEE